MASLATILASNPQTVELARRSYIRDQQLYTGIFALGVLGEMFTQYITTGANADILNIAAKSASDRAVIEAELAKDLGHIQAMLTRELGILSAKSASTTFEAMRAQSIIEGTTAKVVNDVTADTKRAISAAEKAQAYARADRLITKETREVVARLNQNMNRTIGMARVSAAAQGIDPGSGSAADVTSQLRENTQDDMLRVTINGLRDATTIRDSANTQAIKRELSAGRNDLASNLADIRSKVLPDLIATQARGATELSIKTSEGRANLYDLFGSSQSKLALLSGALESNKLSAQANILSSRQIAGPIQTGLTSALKFTTLLV